MNRDSHALGVAPLALIHLRRIVAPGRLDGANTELSSCYEGGRQ